jgi:ribosomal protein S18 acetylase RimI-like enzyme
MQFREATAADVDAMFTLRARTRENPLARAELAARGITPASTRLALRSGQLRCWVCTQRAVLVGFCSGDARTGEVLVVAVHGDFEGTGVGRRLLDLVGRALHGAGCQRLWLAADPDPRHRAHGFYRALGWRATGRRADSGDEILERAGGAAPRA